MMAGLNINNTMHKCIAFPMDNLKENVIFEDGISGLHVNIRSIKKNFDQFTVFVQEFCCQMDFMVLTECWLDGADSNLINFNIPGYNKVTLGKKI